MNLKDNLKRIRKENNLSQEELAEKLNVSRQSVSKWEQGITYPEMDKMLEICKLFNVNIDDLINGDIKESNNTKQVKNSINKFIESFLGYVTKTIDMFSSMKFKNKFACIMEQWLIVLCLFILFKIVGSLGESIISNLLYFLPNNVYNFVLRFIGSIYAVASIILGVILVLHIFKIRYLDYYEVVKNEDIKDEKKETQKAKEPIKENKIYLEKRKEKIIIRDPKHSEYKFISSLFKLVLFIFKLVALLIFGIMCLSLMLLSISFILSFILVKTGLLFIGILLIVLSCIMINYVFLKIFYSFIFSSKFNKNILVSIFFASLVLIGFGIGLIVLSISKYEVVKFGDEDYYIKEEETLDMDNNIFFINETNIDYIESNDKNIRIEYIHMKNTEIVKEKINNGYSIYLDIQESNLSTMMRGFTKALNDNKILLDNDSSIHISVYTNKSNIEILKSNLEKYKNHERSLSCEYNKQVYLSTIHNLQNRVNELENSCN